jgi:hypothetical protein
MPARRERVDALLASSDSLKALLKNPRGWLDGYDLSEQDVACTDEAHVALQKAERLATKANELAALPLADALPRLHDFAIAAWGEDVDIERIPFGVSLAERPTLPGPILDDNPFATTGTGSIKCTFGLNCKADVDR